MCVFEVDFNLRPCASPYIFPFTKSWVISLYNARVKQWVVVFYGWKARKTDNFSLLFFRDATLNLMCRFPASALLLSKTTCILNTIAHFSLLLLFIYLLNGSIAHGNWLSVSRSRLHELVPTITVIFLDKKCALKCRLVKVSITFITILRFFTSQWCRTILRNVFPCKSLNRSDCTKSNEECLFGVFTGLWLILW